MVVAPFNCYMLLSFGMTSSWGCGKDCILLCRAYIASPIATFCYLISQFYRFYFYLSVLIGSTFLEASYRISGYVLWLCILRDQHAKPRLIKQNNWHVRSLHNSRTIFMKTFLFCSYQCYSLAKDRDEV